MYVLVQKKDVYILSRREEGSPKAQQVDDDIIQIQMSVLEEIKQKLQGVDAQAIQIDLNNIKIVRFDEETKAYLQKFKKCLVVLLYDCDLQSLDNFPNWKLDAIQLSNNRLTDSAIARLAAISSLTQIIAVNNQIESLDSLIQLKVLKKLEQVDFTDNPVSEKNNYRAILFDNIKSLQKVDLKDVNGNLIQDDEEDEDESDEQFGDSDQDQQGQGDGDDGDYSEEDDQEEKPRGRKKAK